MIHKRKKIAKFGHNGTATDKVLETPSLWYNMCSLPGNLTLTLT